MQKDQDFVFSFWQAHHFIPKVHSLHSLQQQKTFSEKEIQFHLEIITYGPSIHTMNHPKFVVSSHNEQSIGALRYNYAPKGTLGDKY